MEHVRNLTQLNGDIRAMYVRQALPPAWMVVCYFVSMTPFVALLHGSLPYAMLAASAGIYLLLRFHKRLRGGGPLPHLIALALFAGFCIWGDAQSTTCQLLSLTISAAYALAAACVVVSVLHKAWQVALASRHFSESDLLRIMPSEARQSVDAWKQGDDSHQMEIALVARLATLWLAIQSTEHGPLRAHRPTVHAIGV